jgi:hypothetical protein
MTLVWRALLGGRRLCLYVILARRECGCRQLGSRMPMDGTIQPLTREPGRAVDWDVAVLT